MGASPFSQESEEVVFPWKGEQDGMKVLSAQTIPRSIDGIWVDPHPSALHASTSTNVQVLGNDVGGILHPSGSLWMDLDPLSDSPSPAGPSLPPPCRQRNELLIVPGFPGFRRPELLLLWDQFVDGKRNVLLDVGNTGNCG